MNNLKLTKEQQTISELLVKEICNRLEFLNNVGLGYITLDRAAGTVSGGEAQRIRLATQIGSKLTGVLYVLDEPSIGLHQKDNAKLIDTILDVSSTRENTIKDIQGFEISPCGGKLLVYNNSSKIYRRSFEASYYVFEIKRNILKALSTNHKRQRAPIFSNDGRMVAFVAQNNIYIKKWR